MYNRREVLKLFGLSAVAPSLLVKEERLTGKILEGDVIPTGFPIIDAALKGGFKKGEFVCVYGQARTAFIQSLAVRMGRVASVALVTRRKPEYATHGHSLQEHNVTIWNPYNHHIGTIEQWKMLTDQHDAVVVESGVGGHGMWDAHIFREYHEISMENECAVITRYPGPESYGHLHFYSVYFCVENQDYGNSRLGQLFTLSITKNRRGPIHVVEPIVLEHRGFVPTTEANYWDYEPESGLITGPAITLFHNLKRHRAGWPFPKTSLSAQYGTGTPNCSISDSSSRSWGKQVTWWVKKCTKS